MSDCTVSISMVTHNSEHWMGDFFDSVNKHLVNVKFHLYIIDNKSTDQTVDSVRRRLDTNMTLIENKDNVGFGKAHNMVVDDLKSTYHLIINPDITMNDDVVQRMAEYLDGHEDIGMLTPKMLYPNGTLQILPKKNPRFIYLVARRVNLPFLKKYRAEYEMMEKDMDSDFDIEFCTGAFMFVRTALLKKVGGFDTRYFMYFEDADLTREIRKYARAQYNPSFVIYHEWERGGSKRLKLFMVQLHSMIKYMIKWKKKRKR